MAEAGGVGGGLGSGRGAGLTPPLLMRLARAGGGGRDGRPVEMSPPFWLPLAARRFALRFQFCYCLVVSCIVKHVIYPAVSHLLRLCNSS